MSNRGRIGLRRILEHRRCFMKEDLQSKSVCHSPETDPAQINIFQRSKNSVKCCFRVHINFFQRLYTKKLNTLFFAAFYAYYFTD